MRVILFLLVFVALCTGDCCNCTTSGACCGLRVKIQFIIDFSFEIFFSHSNFCFPLHRFMLQYFRGHPPPYAGDAQSSLIPEPKNKKQKLGPGLTVPHTTDEAILEVCALLFMMYLAPFTKLIIWH